MKKIQTNKAFYIKLGEQGEYEAECLTNPGKARVGWRFLPWDLLNHPIDKIDWEKVLDYHTRRYPNKGTATNQKNQLKNFAESGPDDLWVTFHEEHLYWCFLAPNIERLPDNSKIRWTVDGWHRTDISGTLLNFSRLSGSLLAMQGYRSTICAVREFPYLIRKINCETSNEEQKALDARMELINSLQAIIHNLNWKEFELITDLIFRQAGWQRLSDLGKTQKSIDLDLLSPIDNERYRVQVKSQAGADDFQEFEKLASNNTDASRYYFIVHKPQPDLTKASTNPMVRVWFADDIARLVVNYGLVDWLIAKAK